MISILHAVTWLWYVENKASRHCIYTNLVNEESARLAGIRNGRCVGTVLPSQCGARRSSTCTFLRHSRFYCPPQGLPPNFVILVCLIYNILTIVRNCYLQRWQNNTYRVVNIRLSYVVAMVNLPSVGGFFPSRDHDNHNCNECIYSSKQFTVTTLISVLHLSCTWDTRLGISLSRYGGQSSPGGS